MKNFNSKSKIKLNKESSDQNSESVFYRLTHIDTPTKTSKRVNINNELLNKIDDEILDFIELVTLLDLL